MTNTAGLYGGSLYDLAKEEGIAREVLEQAVQIRALFRENPAYISLLSEPSISLEERCGLIDKAFGECTEKYLLNFMKLLCERGHLKEYAFCCEEFERRYNEDNHIAKAEARCAVALTDAQKKALTARLEKVTGKTVHLTAVVDPSVIGGLLVSIDGKQLDGTLKGRMDSLSRKIEQVTL